MFVGDPHGDFEPCISAIEIYKPEAVIFLGDHDLYEPFHDVLAPVADKTKIWWIPGNHDFDNQEVYNNLFKSRLASQNLHGQVKEIAGYRVAGLGGAFNEQVWHPKYRAQGLTREEWRSFFGRTRAKGSPLPLAVRGAIWREDYKALSSHRADILVTHEAPSCHPLGFREIDQLAKFLEARWVIHGHHHEDYESEINGDQVKVVGVAMAGWWFL